MSSTKIKKIKRLKTIGKLLDNAIPIPFTKYKIGLDPIIGLFPAVGDYLTFFVSAYIVYEAAHLGAKQETLIKMTLNIVVDTLVGSVPVAGDIFDVAWKANQQNLALLEQDLPQAQAGTETIDNAQDLEQVNWKPILLLFGAIAIIIALSSLFFLWLLKTILALIFGG